MKEPVFLAIEEVLAFHSDQARIYGGSPTVRDIGLLQSALAMPAASFGGRYLHKDIHEMAAAYLYHIVRDHPFVDGNKRTGAVTALTFLEVNGHPVHADPEALLKMVMETAEGTLGKDGIAAFFRRYSKGR